MARPSSGCWLGRGCVGSGPSWACPARRPPRPSGPRNGRSTASRTARSASKTATSSTCSPAIRSPTPPRSPNSSPWPEKPTPPAGGNTTAILPTWFRTYVDLEQAATLIRSYEGQFVPGLQTDDYMRAVVRGAHLEESGEEVGRRVRLRMARPDPVDPGGPAAVVGGGGSGRPAPARGGREVMRGQLERLIEATKLPNVTLQILPFASGAHPGHGRLLRRAALRRAGAARPRLPRAPDQRALP